MDNKTMYTVKNRSASRVFYKIPEDNIRREFNPGETKRISFEELEKLSYQSGGRELMANFLQIQSTEATSNLGIHTEPEYNMTEDQIVDLIKTGSLDAFLDCLDFAPVGVIDLLKKFSVSVPLADYDKRQALKEKTGFDVDVALKNMLAEKAEDNAANAITPAAGRRVQPEAEPAAPGRRTAGTSYKVVSKSE
jgi:hypothetical protein